MLGCNKKNKNKHFCFFDPFAFQFRITKFWKSIWLGWAIFEDRSDNIDLLLNWLIIN